MACSEKEKLKVEQAELKEEDAQILKSWYESLEEERQAMYDRGNISNPGLKRKRVLFSESVGQGPECRYPTVVGGETTGAARHPSLLLVRDLQAQVGRQSRCNQAGNESDEKRRRKVPEKVWQVLQKIRKGRRWLAGCAQPVSARIVRRLCRGLKRV